MGPLSGIGLGCRSHTLAVPIGWIRLGSADAPVGEDRAALMSPAKREGVRIVRLVVDLYHDIPPEIVLNLQVLIIVGPGSISRARVDVWFQVAQIPQDVCCNWIDPIGRNLVAGKCRVSLLGLSINWINDSYKRCERIVNRQRLQTLGRTIPIRGRAEVASDPSRVRVGVRVVGRVGRDVLQFLIADKKE